MTSAPSAASLDPARLRAAYEKVREELLDERTPGGHWVGELSSSALSTATAISALSVVKAATGGRGLESAELQSFISRGVAWWEACSRFRSSSADNGSASN